MQLPPPPSCRRLNISSRHVLSRSAHWKKEKKKKKSLAEPIFCSLRKLLVDIALPPTDNDCANFWFSTLAGEEWGWLYWLICRGRFLAALFRERGGGQFTSWRREILPSSCSSPAENELVARDTFHHIKFGSFLNHYRPLALEQHVRARAIYAYIYLFTYIHMHVSMQYLSKVWKLMQFYCIFTTFYAADRYWRYQINEQYMYNYAAKKTICKKNVCFLWKGGKTFLSYFKV